MLQVAQAAEVTAYQRRPAGWWVLPGGAGARERNHQRQAETSSQHKNSTDGLTCWPLRASLYKGGPAGMPAHCEPVLAAQRAEGMPRQLHLAICWGVPGRLHPFAGEQASSLVTEFAGRLIRVCFRLPAGCTARLQAAVCKHGATEGHLCPAPLPLNSR